MSGHETSAVQYFSDHKGTKCGYCGSLDSYYSKGMWAYYLTCEVYEMLIDRGWRRSGHYCYKPTMERTCCPMYTIRCKVEDFELSKSQKRVIKKVNAFLKTGKRNMDVAGATGDLENLRDALDDSKLQLHSEKLKNLSCNIVPGCLKAVDSLPSTSGYVGKDEVSGLSEMLCEVLVIRSKTQDHSSISTMEKVVAAAKYDKPEHMSEDATMASESNTVNVTTTAISKGLSADHQLPRKKAKLIRQDNKYKRLLKKGLSEEEAQKIAYNTKKGSPKKKELEELLYEVQGKDVAHKLEVKIVRTKPLSEEYKATALQTYNLYKKYQMEVHGDEEYDCSINKFKRFLVDSPLIPFRGKYSSIDSGSFHHQYWLDGTLIAVGVIDILQYCISSVYYFYDPDFRDLSLGTYGSLREIALVREYRRICPNFTYYYLGFYIHSCPKMNYKAKYKPSHLLCPVVYTWHRIEKCLPKLEINKFSRLDDFLWQMDEDKVLDCAKVLIYKNQELMTYRQYRVHFPDDPCDDIEEYVILVGGPCAERIALCSIWQFYNDLNSVKSQPRK